MQDEQLVKDIMDMMKDDFDKAIFHLKCEFQSIRAGRANPHILDKIVVDYYGVPTPINQMANVSVPEARMLVISVWDQSQVRNVSKAISMSDIGITPNDDGKVIRLIFPALTEERRKEIVKQVKKIGEETKVVIRNARRDALDEYKQMKKNNELSEDELAGLEKDVQKVTDDFIATIDSLSSAKEKEVLEI